MTKARSKSLRSVAERASLVAAVVVTAALPACRESDAETAATTDAASSLAGDRIRVGLLERSEGRYRWRIELGSEVQAVSYGVTAQGEPTGELGRETGLTSPFEVTYIEQKPAGADRPATARHTTDATARRFRLTFGSRSIAGEVPVGPVGEAANWASYHHIGLPDGKPSELTCGKVHILAAWLATDGEGGFFGTIAGIPHVHADGKLAPFDEVLRSGKHPGWALWIRADTGER